MNKGIRLGAAVAVAAVASMSLGLAAHADSRTVITIEGGYAASDAAAFQADLDLAFPASSGIKVNYTSLASFDTDITTEINAGTNPDIAMWPQPGGLLAQSAHLADLKSLLGTTNFNAIVKTEVPGFELLGKGTDGVTYGLPVSANLKSIVFYNPAVFKANGWKVPTSYGQFVALQKQIAASGKAYPWCAGTESGGATGWSLTDWMEELVLKNYGVATYNKWWKGQVSWNSTQIKNIGKQLASTLLSKGQTQGGGQGVTSRFFGLATTQGLFQTSKAKGACALLKQGSFITAFMPDSIKAELAANNYKHVGVFAFPSPKVNAVLGGGDTAAVFTNTPEYAGNQADVAKVAQYIMSDKMATHGYATNASGFLSPHKTFSTRYLVDPMAKQFQSIFAKAKGFGFDGSAQAPPAVNAAEWSELTNWFAGKESMAKAFSIIANAYNN